MPTAASDRAFSAPPSIHNVSALYVWNPAFVVNNNTGNWVPFSTTGTNGALTPAPYTYTTTVANLVGTGHTIIPVTAKAWSVSVISGAVWVKGVGPILPGASLGGGGFDGRGTMASTIAVGGTGAGASAVNALVVYDA